MNIKKILKVYINIINMLNFLKKYKKKKKKIGRKINMSFTYGILREKNRERGDDKRWRKEESPP